MKKAPNLRLSLRKLLIATMAVGPLAVLPSPLWAVIPTYVVGGTTNSFTVANGTATVASSANVANISTTDRAVLVWGTDNTTALTGTVSNFNIAPTETYNFILPSGGAVLNRVTRGTGTGNAATIAGTLFSTGRVFVLSDSGNIVVSNGAVISTAGGLVLSTLNEGSSGAFTSFGDLTYTGVSNGDITIGATASVGGNLTAIGGTVAFGAQSVAGDVVLRSVTSAAGINLGGSIITGNLSVTTNNGALTQTGPVVVGTTNGTQTTTLNTGSGAVALSNTGNDFKVLTAQTTGTAGVTVADANIITLGTSTIGGDLVVEAGGQINTTAIATNGTLTIGGGATFNSTRTSNSAVNIGNNSTIAGTVNANTAGGTITINTVGNLTTGTINSRVTNNLAVTAGPSAITSTLTPLTSLAPITVASGGAGYTTPPLVVISAPPAGGTQATATATVSSAGVITGIVITDPGSGYLAAPTVTLAPAGETTAATLGAISLSGSVAGVSVPLTPSAPGAYAAAPTVTFGVAPTGGVRATGTAIFDADTGVVSGVTITNPGAGYTTAPSVTVATPAASVIGRNIAVTTSGNLTVGGTISSSNNTTTPSITLTGANVAFAGGTVSNTGPVTINATAGSAALGTISANQVTVRATADITQGLGTTITTSNQTGTSLFNAGNYVNVNQANSFAANATTSQTIQLTGAQADFYNTNNITLGTTNVTGHVSLVKTTPGGSIVLGTGTGTGAGQNIVVGGVLSVTGSGAATITDNDYTSIVATEGLNLTTGSGDIRLDAANVLGSLSENTQFGRVTASTTGEVYIVETTTLNLGNITAGNLVATSVNGDIVDSGILNVTELAYFSLPRGNLTLGNTSSTIGRISVQGGAAHSIVSNTTLTLHSTTNSTGSLSLTTGNGAGVVLTGGTVAGNLTVNSNGTVSVTTAPTNVGGNLALTAAGAVTDTAPGSIAVAGNTTLSSGTSIVLDSANDFRNVVLNSSSGDVTIADINDLTISGNTSGALTATAGANLAGSIANPWALTLGNLHVNSLVVASGNGGGGASGNLTQLAGTSIHSETTSEFRTRDANIVIGNNGNSFGRVQLFVDGPSAARTVTLVEDSTLRLGNLNSRGTTTLTSRFGSIIEDSTANVVITNNGTLSANAPSGSILLGNTTHTAGTTTGNLTAFAASAPNGAVAVSSSSGNANIALGNITAQSLTVTSGNNITQSGRLNIFGTTNLTATNNITLANTTNNFGRVFLTTTNAENGNIQIVEGATLNLGGVTMAPSATANFTATSVNGDIIDSGLGGLRPGGTIAAPGTGSITLTATNGNITLDDPTTDFASSSGVSFTGGNVTIAVLGQTPLLLGAAGVTSTATNLAVTSAVGNIGNAGNITVTGDAAFQTGNGNITLTQPDNRFGAVRFNAAGLAGSGQVRINQANDINIITGSSATGEAEFVAGTYITIENRGGTVSLGSTGNFTAAGSIVLPKLIQAVGTLTVNSPSLKDLGALSQAADLAGKAPVNLGPGTYIAPQP